jgi:hypothetical protein
MSFGFAVKSFDVMPSDSEAIFAVRAKRFQAWVCAAF